MKFKLGFYQLDIFNIPSCVSFEHFYASFRNCLSGMPYILGKYISKFVFENSWFKAADTFQSLLCDGRSAAVGNKSRTCWATIMISFLYARLKNGTYYAVAMSVRPSVRLSVRPSVRVFRTFLQHALRYQFETWYMHSVGGMTCRVWVASQLGQFDLVYSQK